MPNYEPIRSKMTAASNEAISRDAARWVVLSDRGLTGAELAEFEQWLAADVRHRRAIAASTATWGLMDRMATELVVMPDAEESRSRLSRNILITFATAAALALAVAGWMQVSSPKANIVASSATADVSPRTLLLSDGTLVSLNSGAAVSEEFTADQRSVVLLRGEAHFNVKKNAKWPFVVRAGNARVIAVGTAFDVEFRSRQIEVVVTEGKVRVASNVSEKEVSYSGPSAEGPMVKAGQQAVIGQKHFFAPWTVEIADSDPQNLARIFAWKDPLTSITGATLGDLAADFRRRIGYRLVFADPEIASLRIGGRFRVDDVEDFVRLIADNFGLESDHIGQNETVLRLRK
jgi:transmembrane sensor